MVACVTPASQRPMNTCSHLVDFFSADEHLIARVADYLQEGFESECACIAVMTPSHLASVDAVLTQRGLNSAELIAAYRYVTMDAHAVLRTLRPDGSLDFAEFHRSFGQLISLAGTGNRPVRIVGEMVRLLAEEGIGDAVIQLEEMWNDLSRDYAFTLYCVYSEHVFVDSLSVEHRTQIRALHSHAPR